METRAHLGLKRLAARWLLAQGAAAVAAEVRCPLGTLRLDVAGYQDRQRSPGPVIDMPSDDADGGPLFHRWEFIPCSPRTIVIECKQARSDFLRDRSDIDKLHAERQSLNDRRVFLEEHRIKHEEPHLRRSDQSLLPGEEEWDFRSTRLKAYGLILERLDRVEIKLHGQTKFARMANWRLADQMYLIAPSNIVRRADVPPGWGLLTCSLSVLEREEVDINAVRTVIEAPMHACSADHRNRLLRNIAVAATKANDFPETNASGARAPGTEQHREV